MPEAATRDVITFASNIANYGSTRGDAAWSGGRIASSHVHRCGTCAEVDRQLCRSYSHANINARTDSCADAAATSTA
jgi:hypothetical protein